MHRIDSSTATPDNKFTEGDPTIPVAATTVTADWLNSVQEELVKVVTEAGLELDKPDTSQLWQAIVKIIGVKAPIATTKAPGLVQVGSGLDVTAAGLLSVLVATAARAGIVKPDGVTITTNANGVISVVSQSPSKYDLCEFYFFRHPTLKPGFQPAQGGLLANAATLYPEAWAYLQTAEGQLLCKTESEWQAMTTATWATLADGTKVGWNGIGGAPFYVVDTANGTLRLPDLRGMYAEAAGFDSLGVGDSHGDMMRKIEGTIGYAANGHWVQGKTSKAFAITYTPNMGSSLMLDDITRDYTASFDSSRVVPVGTVNKTRAWGALVCCYLGAPAL